MGRDLLVGEKLHFGIGDSGAHIGDEILQDRSDQKSSGGEGGEMGIKDGLPGTVDQLQSPARELARIESALVMPVNVGRAV